MNDSELRVEICDAMNHAFLFGLRQLREHRERQHLSRGAFRFWQVAGAVAQVSKTGLKMQRDGIVDLGADVSVAKKLAQFIAALRPDHVLMKDVKSMRRSLERFDRRVESFRCQPRIGQQTI